MCKGVCSQRVRGRSSRTTPNAAGSARDSRGQESVSTKLSHQSTNPPFHHHSKSTATLTAGSSHYCSSIANSYQKRLDQHGCVIGAGPVLKGASQLPVNQPSVE